MSERLGALGGFTVGITAERRAHHQQRFLEARGARVQMGPVLATRDASSDRPLAAATQQLIEHAPDILVVQTGQGLRWWLDAMAPDEQDAIRVALERCQVLCRGPKAASTCKGLALPVSWMAPNESAADIAAWFHEHNVDRARIALLLDGNDDRQLSFAALAEGATVVELDVYRYQLPPDLQPAEHLIRQVTAGAIAAVTFTSSPAIRHFREIASLMQMDDELDRAFSDRCLAVVVGPVCAVTAQEAGWKRIIEPPTPRLLPMLSTLESCLSQQ